PSRPGPCAAGRCPLRSLLSRRARGWRQGGDSGGGGGGGGTWPGRLHRRAARRKGGSADERRDPPGGRSARRPGQSRAGGGRGPLEVRRAGASRPARGGGVWGGWVGAG